MMNAEKKSNICDRLACFNALHSTPALRIFHSFSGSHRNISFKDDAVVEEELCSDKEIKDLLKEIEITYNPAKLLKQQRLLLTYLYRSKELKQDRIMHELKLSISEKNHLREKMEHLEEEIKSMRICNELWNSDNKLWENNLLNILCQVIQQRDIALSKVNNAQSEHTNYSIETGLIVQLSPDEID
ncbi:uncharacterized protein TNCV_3681711 [Trichonephila clavipes]|uniref:Uncharacterized protein n=1 Tax=Trichonephila clavipes TaxID=2585209 RepID=A0A8X6RCI9_TRICX|nr:uncharacterized protein TNCV_3681711 [Trichonephila clavipes]